MLIEPYYTESNSKVLFSRKQASDFAKKVADDFNPLHDIENNKFCVPGDLLFSLVLSKYGVSEHMSFTFSGMVKDATGLKLPEPAPQFTLKGSNDKEYMGIERRGNHSTDTTLIDNLTRSYVSFSGMTFPHLLVPLLKEKNVMINPTRPFVIYQSMIINLQRLDCPDLELQLDQEKTLMDVNGKRGKALLAFNLIASGEKVGFGEKHMILSGLKDFEQSGADSLETEYTRRKDQFKLSPIQG
ncbi:MAG: DUF3581 family protein [Spongiibacteraceae bacterium]|nr:DUF3581 family protein [Spongiibacteraceae bacterium]